MEWAPHCMFTLTALELVWGWSVVGTLTLQLEDLDDLGPQQVWSPSSTTECRCTVMAAMSWSMTLRVLWLLGPLEELEVKYNRSGHVLTRNRQIGKISNTPKKALSIVLDAKYSRGGKTESTTSFAPRVFLSPLHKIDLSPVPLSRTVESMESKH